MNAVISNAKHPEYGHVTVSFPIPAEKYENVLDLLNVLEIGDTLVQDCKIDKLYGDYTILKRLEGSSVNIDELNFLANCFETFRAGEDAKFQGTAVMLGISDIKDFINLAFCCQEATVITDFSDLEKVGKNHLLTIHGGCMPSEQLKHTDGRLAALDLIGNHDGYVTSYGVVYGNGMELEQLYDGRHFPFYLCDTPVLAVEAASVDAASNEYRVTGLFSLPMPERQLTRLMQRAEAECPDVHLQLIADELPEKVSDALDLGHLVSEDLADLNRLCKAIAPMSSTDMEKLNAAVLLTDTSGISPLCHLADNLNLFQFVPNVRTPEEYGRYMLQQNANSVFDEGNNISYRSQIYGEQLIKTQDGQFNDFGYVAYRNATAFNKFMQEQQSPQEPQMGGMAY